MTGEEAIRLLNYMVTSYIPKDQYGDYDDPEPYEQAIGMAIEALQKSIPKPPKKDKEDNLLCPLCGENVDWHKYCEECGQAIEW